ncbi:MAG: divergent polysaccharide deacetylase family protein [Deltaproteobacteria bacterium]|nr:divergent polysaccharide deacetylase family protein [Deltaproteobacteria bacterium]
MNRRRFLARMCIYLSGFLLGFSQFPRSSFASGNRSFQEASTARIALIIDDIGWSRRGALAFLDLNVPITFSVLPQLRYSNVLAGELHEAGQEIMLHQPMEPQASYLDPGPGALFVGDPADRIERTVTTNIEDIPHIRGVNNHMGSRLTESNEEITLALKTIGSQDLFFIDSRTSSRSKAFPIARSLNMTASFSNLCIDYCRDGDYTLRQLEKLGALAKSNGTAIAIGHPHLSTLKALRTFLHSPASERLTFVHVSQTFSES